MNLVLHAAFEFRKIRTCLAFMFTSRPDSRLSLNIAQRSASIEGRAGRTIPDFINRAQSNSRVPPSVEIAPTHSANSALYDLTLSGHHTTAAHHSTAHHSSAHHSATAHRSSALEEFAHSTHLHLLRVITVVNNRFTDFLFGFACSREHQRQPGSSCQKRYFSKPSAA